MARVLRLVPGDELVLFDGCGQEATASIAEIRGSTVCVTAAVPVAVDRESPLRLTLVQGVSRGERMDLVMQKATELGVARLVPVMTERSVVKLDAAQAAKRLQGMSNHHALGRIGTSTEIAEGIEFAIRAEWVTGTVIAIDGGLGLGVTI